MSPLAPDTNAVLNCRWSSTGYDGDRSNTAVQHGILSRVSWLDAAPGGWNIANHPPAIATPYVEPHRSVCLTPWPELKSP